MFENLIRLRGDDCAIIYRADGSVEVRIPNGTGDDIVPPTVTQLMNAVALPKVPAALRLVEDHINSVVNGDNNDNACGELVAGRDGEERVCSPE